MLVTHFVGGDTDEFSIIDDGCVASTLAGGATCTIQVEFVPETAAAKSTGLHITDNSGEFEATSVLTGTGT